MSFAGKVALITGAGSGIGRATAGLFAARGGAVLAADLNEAGVRATVASIRAAGGKAEGCRCDVTRWADVEAAVARARSAFAELDVLVHCAGILKSHLLVETPEDEWRHVLDVNLTGAFLATKAALQAMRGRGGSIVHIASRMAIRVKEGHGAYAAAKAGIVQLTQMAALEGAPQIRVNCVLPGFVDSPMTRAGYGEDAFDGWNTVCPLRRAAVPDDIARAMLFLASDDAAFITGVALPVDGGRTIL
jgi:NAD(P)-dependent dehydrogenase (short-subunit alcohol dehydrogenase family)